MRPERARARAPRAFQNGRTLAKEGAPLALLAVLRRAGAAPEVVAAACGAVKRLAVNEDICMEFADAGGVQACLEVCASLHAGQAVGSACLVGAAACFASRPNHELCQLCGGLDWQG